MLNTSTDHKDFLHERARSSSAAGCHQRQRLHRTPGSHLLIDGVTPPDSAVIDQYGHDGIIQNCVAYLTPTGGGATGYSTAIVLRAKPIRATGNIIRFNTLITGKFACLVMADKGFNTQWYGNIMLADKDAVTQWGPDPNPKEDVAGADYNFYGPLTTVAGLAPDAWKALGFDAHSLAGDPKFADPAKHNFALRATSLRRHGQGRLPIVPPQTSPTPPHPTNRHWRLRKGRTHDAAIREAHECSVFR